MRLRQYFLPSLKETPSDADSDEQDTSPKIMVEDDEWEQASQEDIESGEFETA